MNVSDKAGCQGTNSYLTRGDDKRCYKNCVFKLPIVWRARQPSFCLTHP